ncbi:MAG TPA: hypothetical protein VHA05_03230 [Candidatus Saccharimonadales bacterium]|nr:hypothetical protein [Candidatus Saccharimonadales bacterium]
MANVVSKVLVRPSYVNNPTALILVRYAALAILYVVLIFALPGNQAIMREHRLTTAEYHVLQFLVALPLMAVWFMAFYGYAKLEEYTLSIRKTPEAIGFSRLTQGCAWMAWSLPVHSIVSLITRSITNSHAGFGAAEAIITNYVDLIFPVVGFTLIGMASRHLFDRAKMALSAASIRGIIILFVAGGVLYCYLTFRQFTGTGLGATDNPYHLPVWLTVLTIIVPYLYAWFAGMLAVYELVTYGRHVRGVLYRQSMHILVTGLFAMILGSIAFQYAGSFQPSTGHQVLGIYLIFSLVFQIVSGIGFLMIALGATRLKKIEEV